MEDSVGGLKFLGRLVAIAIAHLREIFNWTAFGRLVLLSILQKLKHNKIMLLLVMHNKEMSKVELIYRSLGAVAIAKGKCGIAGQAVTSIIVIGLTEDVHWLACILR
jgi:hypothetical protein